MPFAENKRASQLPPSPKVIEDFCDALCFELQPWVVDPNASLTVSSSAVSSLSPWNGVRVSVNGPDDAAKPTTDLADLLDCADQLAATEVIFPGVASGCLWLGRLNQARYWSKSQARLIARNIAWEHLDLLTGGREA